MSMLSFACDQDQNTAYFPRTEINPLAPNPDTAKLINFSFVETDAAKSIGTFRHEKKINFISCRYYE